MKPLEELTQAELLHYVKGEAAGWFFDTFDVKRTYRWTFEWIATSVLLGVMSLEKWRKWYAEERGGDVRGGDSYFDALELSWFADPLEVGPIILAMTPQGLDTASSSGLGYFGDQPVGIGEALREDREDNGEVDVCRSLC